MGAAAAVATLGTIAALAAPMGCTADLTVVGGACAEGYTQCGEVCVDLQDDPNNCGGCGVSCPAVPGVCMAGKCVVDSEAGTVDAGDAGDGGRRHHHHPEAGADANGPDGDFPDAWSGEAGTQDVRGIEGGDASAPDTGNDVSATDGATPEGAADVIGSDAPSSDAPPVEGSVIDAPAPDGSTPDAVSGDAFSSDVASPDAPSADGGLDARIADGGPDAPRSEASTPDGALPEGSADVVSTDAAGCTPPQQSCSGVCVDETTDPDNCGVCGHVCPSGICYMGVCEGSTDGNIVLIGHDYSSSLSTLSEGKLIANAVFLPSTSPIEILSFERYADPKAVSNIKSILAVEAGLLGRTLSYTVTSNDKDIPAKLDVATFDVLLVYDQEAAGPGVLGPLGKSWASTLSTFTIAGGVVIALDGAAGTTQEMPEFDTKAGLLAVTGHSVISKGTPLSVIAPGDVIGNGVVSPYAAQPNTVSFDTSVPSGGFVTYVVTEPTDGGSVPVVVHINVP